MVPLLLALLNLQLGVRGYLAPCVSQNYPLGTGDQSASSTTAFYSMDMDSYGNIVAGGYTTSTNLCTQASPIVEYYSATAGVVWSKNLYVSGYNRVDAVKFNTAFGSIAAVFDKPSASTPLRIVYLQSADGAIIKQYLENVPSGFSGSSLIYPNSVIHGSDDTLYIAMMLYSRWTFFKINILSATTTPITSPFFYLQKSSSFDSHCSRALALIREGSSFYISGLFKGSDSDKCHSAGLTRISVYSSSSRFRWSVSLRQDATSSSGQKYFYLGHLEKTVSSNSDSYLYACGYRDTSTSASESSGMVAAFARYTIDSDLDIQDDETKIIYYDTDDSENLNSKCIAISQSGYALVLNTATGTSALKSHIVQIQFTSSSPTAYIYDLTPFEFTGNMIRHGLFTQSGTNVAFVGDLLQTTSYTQAQKFGFAMYMPVAAGSFTDTCLTFNTISYSPSNKRSLVYLTISSIIYKQSQSTLESYFTNETTTHQFASTSDIASTNLVITSTANNRISCAASGRVPTIVVDPMSSVTRSVGSTSNLWAKVTYKVYQDTDLANQCNMSAQITIPSVTPAESTITLDSDYVKWTSSTPASAYSIQIKGTLSNAQSSTEYFSLTIGSTSCSSSMGITAPAQVFTTTIAQYNLFPQTPITYTLNAFTAAVGACTLQYTIAYQDGSPISGSAFSFSGMDLTVGPTSDNSQIGTHYLKVTADNFNGAELSTNFQFIIGRAECQSAVISLDQAVTDQVFKISADLTTPEQILLPTFTSSQPSTLCGDWTYELTKIYDSSGSLVTNFGGTSNVFAWDSSYSALSTYLALYPQSLYISPYTIVVQAYQGPYSSQTMVSQSFEVALTQHCIVTSLAPNPLDLISADLSEMAPQEYIIGSSALSVKVNPFIQSADCKYSLTYTLSVSGGGTLPSFVKGSFSPQSGGTISVQSSKRSDASKPIIILLVTATTLSNQNLISTQPNATLTIPIVIKVQNLGPPQFKSDPTAITTSVGQIFSWSLPTYSDPDQPSDKILAECNFAGAASFIEGTFPSFTLKPTSNQDHAGSFSLTITLKDDNPNQQSTTYTISLTVSPGENSTNTAEENILPAIDTSIFGQTAIKQRSDRKNPIAKNAIELKATLRSVNQNGVAVIGFNVPVLIISNLTAVNPKILMLSVSPGVDSDPTKLGILSWSALKMDSMSLSLQLVFENPIYITQYLNPDFLKIMFISNEYFVNEETFLPIKNETVISKKIPKQLLASGATAMLQSAAGPTSSTMNSVMFGNLALNLVMAASLQFLWGMINVMQMIVNMPLLSVQFPSNAVLFYSFIKDISNFDIIPTEKIKAAIFKFSNEDEETDEQFNQMGYESTNIVDNLGSMMLYITGFVGLVAFVLLIRFLRRKYKAIEKTYTYLSNMIFFNLILRTLMEGYIQYAITSMMNITNLSWGTSSDRFSSVFAITVFSVVVVFPFFVWRLLWTRPDTVLSQPLSQVRYGSVYFELKIESKHALLYNVLYMLRRLLFAGIIIVFEQQTFLQIQLMVFHCLLLIMYNKSVKPFEKPLLNNLEVFNEVCIIAAAYHLFLFTAFLDDPESQYLCGFSIIGVTTFNIVVNMAVMVRATYQQLKLLFVKLRHKYRVYQSQKQKTAQVEDPPEIQNIEQVKTDFDVDNAKEIEELAQNQYQVNVKRRGHNRRLLEILGIAQTNNTLHQIQQIYKEGLNPQIDNDSNSKAFVNRKQPNRFGLMLRSIDSNDQTNQHYDRSPSSDPYVFERTQSSNLPFNLALAQNLGGSPANFNTSFNQSQKHYTDNESNANNRDLSRDEIKQEVEERKKEIYPGSFKGKRDPLKMLVAISKQKTKFNRSILEDDEFPERARNSASDEEEEVLPSIRRRSMM